MIPEGQAIPYVDEEGNLLGMWLGLVPDTGFPVDKIPEDGRQKWDGSAWFYPLDVAKRISLDRLTTEFTQAMERIQSGWPLLEVLTWDKQAYEAARWEAAPVDSKPDTPFLTSLFEKCAALGAKDTFEALVRRIRANDKAYTEAVTSIMAVRHVAETQIEASDEPMSVTWQFP